MMEQWNFSRSYVS